MISLPDIVCIVQFVQYIKIVAFPCINLKSSTGNFEYFTSADIGAYWSDIDLEAVAVEESELPK